MLPDPVDRPTLPLWPDVGQMLGLSRTATYDAARRGEIPTLRFGRRVVVPTAALRRLLAIVELDDPPGHQAGEVTDTTSARGDLPSAEELARAIQGLLEPLLRRLKEDGPS